MNTIPVKVLLVTTMGNITIELYDDMPITSGNFRNLTEHACKAIESLSTNDISE